MDCVSFSLRELLDVRRTSYEHILQPDDLVILLRTNDSCSRFSCKWMCWRRKVARRQNERDMCRGRGRQVLVYSIRMVSQPRRQEGLAGHKRHSEYLRLAAFSFYEFASDMSTLESSRFSMWAYLVHRQRSLLV